MAYYGSQIQATMTTKQLQMRNELRMHFQMQQQMHTNANVTRPMAAANTGRAAGLPQHQQKNGGQPSGTAMQGGTTVTGLNKDGDKTLELKQLLPSLDPQSVEKQAPTFYSSLLQLYNKLPKEDSALLLMAECFTFVYRKRGPHEKAVMPNAVLYVTRLKQFNSPLCDKLETLTGFRCCGCAHTTHNPNNYTVGAAQLLSGGFVNAETVSKAMEDLREHMVICPCVSPDMKTCLTKTSVRDSSEHSSLGDYIEIWTKATRPLLNATNNKGRTGGPVAHVPQTATAMARKAAPAPAQQVLALPKGNTDTAQRGPVAQSAAAIAASRAIQQQAAISDKEDEIYNDLEHSLHRSLVDNNFGLANLKPIIIVSDLSELPSPPDMMVSPLLEVLLQSFCVMQRWTPARSAGNKRSSQEMEVPTTQIRRQEIFFECVHCNDPSHSFCATTGSAREAADFICGSGCKHVSEDCKKTPSALKTKINNMKLRSGTEKINEQAKVVEASFLLWQQLVFPGKKKGKSASKKATPIHFWKPLTWGYLKETAGAALRADKLACADASVALLGKADKKLPYATKDNDVLVGWSGPHLGNRRFIALLNETHEWLAKEMESSLEELSPSQQKAVAEELVSKVVRRGGQFQFVHPNYMMPATLATPEKSVSVALRALKHGAMVILKPPPPDVRGRGSCILEMEHAPQQDVFSKEIVRNKRHIRVPLEEEE